MESFCSRNVCRTNLGWFVNSESEFDKLNILHQKCVKNWGDYHIIDAKLTNWRFCMRNVINIELILINLENKIDNLKILHRKCIQNWVGSHIVKANGRIKMPVTSISTTELGRNNNQTQPSHFHIHLNHINFFEIKFTPKIFDVGEILVPFFKRVNFYQFGWNSSLAISLLCESGQKFAWL